MGLVGTIEEMAEHLFLSKLGAVVECRASKPGGWLVAYGARRRDWGDEEILVAQDEACCAVVEQKVGQLEEGQRLAISLLVEDDGCWLLDGHHSLAAALLTDKCEQLDVWEYARGGLAVGVPRLVCGKR